MGQGFWLWSVLPLKGYWYWGLTNLKFAELNALVPALLAYLQMSGRGVFSFFTVCVGSSLFTSSHGNKNYY